MIDGRHSVVDGRLGWMDLGSGMIDGRHGVFDRNFGLMGLGSGVIDLGGGVVKLDRGISKMTVDFLMRSAGVFFQTGSGRR